jgi:wyosine [tRNA(Phe)-imidazoG37] synthetase (radical SAM superfamily)
MIPNSDIRSAIKESKIYTWQVAEELNVHENTLYRMLRRPLSDKKKEEILNIISKLSQQKYGKEGNLE